MAGNKVQDQIDILLEAKERIERKAPLTEASFVIEMIIEDMVNELKSKEY